MINLKRLVRKIRFEWSKQENIKSRNLTLTITALFIVFIVLSAIQYLNLFDTKFMKDLYVIRWGVFLVCILLYWIFHKREKGHR